MRCETAMSHAFRRALIAGIVLPLCIGLVVGLADSRAARGTVDICLVGLAAAGMSLVAYLTGLRRGAEMHDAKLAHEMGGSTL